MTNEEKKLDDARSGSIPWRRWGPYLSERQWGTVREDYSPNGTAWEYLPHDHARSRAYRWGEDGIAGISDEHQILCFALALWNGKDPILKERLFGLTGNEGNHGEDVKEYYFYLDNVPSHSYMKYLYKYPQSSYPYTDLVEENKKRTRKDFEYELLDTGIFNENRYFDVFVEYAKADPDDILIQITIANRGPNEASLHLLPTLWFRNTWSWKKGTPKPNLSLEQKTKELQVVKASHPELGDRWLYCDHPDALLFTENETNKERLFNSPNNSPYVKDGINQYIIENKKNAINPESIGTKVAADYKLQVGSQQSVTIKLRLSNKNNLSNPFTSDFDEKIKSCKADADAFYQRIAPYPLTEDMRNVQRQAFAGLLWNKQFFCYAVDEWLAGDPAQPPPPEGRKTGRNSDWWSLNASNIFSMPDKWEYPWFASWDLAFHTISLAMIDPDFAKEQLVLLTKEWYMHPNGQIPAYEWAFGDVNPPVHAWAALRVYEIEDRIYKRKDRVFLEMMFQKLVLNFTWWVNKKDAGGKNIFEGGFLGLDNVSAFDRTRDLPAGSLLEQPDGTGWMAMYCLNLLQLALELALEDPIYESMATKFFEHFVYISDAINDIGGKTTGLWDEKNSFYYGLLRTPDGGKVSVAVDTVVGIIPIFAVMPSDPEVCNRFPGYKKRFQWFVDNKAQLVKNICNLSTKGLDAHMLFALTSPEKLKKILTKVLDENQFLSPFGIRSVSKKYEKQPFTIRIYGNQYGIDYEPAESTTGLFGGNSNWRGPVWFPPNYLFIESLQKYHYSLGNDFKVEFPVGSGNHVTLWDVSIDLSHRLVRIFLKDEKGRRPVYGGIEKFQNDPHWKDYILFHEYFHGDNGAGLGASAQTGWTSLVAKLIDQYGLYVLEKKPPVIIEKGKFGNV